MFVETVKNSNFKYFLIILAIFLGILIIISCTKEHERSEKKTPPLNVYTTLYILEHFVKILLPEFQVDSITPTGVDPHHFEPSLKDIQRIHSANMIVYIGDTDVDRWIDKVKDELISKGIKVIRLQDNLNLLRYSSSKEFDPHIWLDPLLALEILKIIKQKALELYPEGKDSFEKNFIKYEQKLKELDSLYREALSKCLLKNVISTHEFLNYLAKKYGFNSYFIVHEPEHEPSPKKIKQLKEFMKKNSIEYIISEPEGEKIAMVLSQETGAKILNFNTYHTKTEKDYINAMKENLRILSTAMKCDLKNGK